MEVVIETLCYAVDISLAIGLDLILIITPSFVANFGSRYRHSNYVAVASGVGW